MTNIETTLNPIISWVSKTISFHGQNDTEMIEYENLLNLFIAPVSKISGDIVANDKYRKMIRNINNLGIYVPNAHDNKFNFTSIKFSAT